jgi:hypothetical protein
MRHKRPIDKRGQDMPGARKWKEIEPISNNFGPKSFGLGSRKQGTNA